jgi:type III restriction enzyme
LKLELKDFQVTAVDELVAEIRAAQADVYRKPQAVSLSAPTGSGKTVIVTAAAERLVDGDDVVGGDPDVRFLWLTDQPELNEQSLRKIRETSTVFSATQLRVIDSSFDQATLDAGCVYFLNTQKLGKDKALVTRGDDRTYTLWETVRNTAALRPGALVVFIDEAHRGMKEDRRAREAATTIVQKFIKGDDSLPPVPLIVGISATPKRFHDLIQGSGRLFRPVATPPDAVRASGLLKQAIRLYHPIEDQPSDMTLLREAARALKRFETEWRGYCDSANEPLVRPLLVVQVRDGNDRVISETNLAEALAGLQEELGNPPNQAFAHTFQENAAVSVGDGQLRYLAPPDVQRDPDARVVFFKTSLNTGWDCPRAEVMMSFRTAHDADTIAQLIGRMVRTPLARSIEGTELLNTVRLYLPHYDRAGLDAVIKFLTEDGGDAVPPTDVEDATKLVTVVRAPGSERCFDALSRIPSYIIPRRRNASQVNRLMKLSRCLASSGVDADAIEKATDLLVDKLLEHYAKVEKTDEFQAVLQERGTIDLNVLTRQLDGTQKEEAMRVATSSENLNDLFAETGRKLREGVHIAYLKRRTAAGVSPSAAKLELAALCRDGKVVADVTARASAEVQGWLKSHAAAIRKLPDRDRARIDDVRALAMKPEIVALQHPPEMDVRVDDDTYQKHIYVNAKGLCPMDLNGWESAVVGCEVGRVDVIGWLRNVARKPWSLCVPYRKNGEYKGLYPDFLFFRIDKNEVVVDLLDPHRQDLTDAVPKAVGLAEYATLHGHEFGRIQIVRVGAKGEIWRLDLTDEATCKKVMAVQSPAHLDQLFADAAK